MLSGCLHKMKIFLFLIAFIGFGGSYTLADEWDSKEVVKECHVTFESKSDMEIFLNAISGELIVEETSGDEVVATMEARCHHDTGNCVEHFADLEFTSKWRGNKLSIGTNKGLGYKGDRSVKTVLSIPRVNRLNVEIAAGQTDISLNHVNELNVDMKAGELDIDVGQLDSFLNVNLLAGEVKINIPEASVGEIDLDAGIGDASIRRDGIKESAPRSFLVGARTHKYLSDGGAALNVDVQMGNIQLDLTKK